MDLTTMLSINDSGCDGIQASNASIVVNELPHCPVLYETNMLDDFQKRHYYQQINRTWMQGSCQLVEHEVHLKELDHV